MARDDVIRAAQELVRAGRALVLATVDQQGVPQVRWMGGSVLEEPLTVYLAAAADSRKMGQIAAHPKAQLMLQTEDYSRVANLTGECEVVADLDVKRRIWDAMPGAASHFASAEDPNFGVIKFICQRVEVLGMTEGMGPQAAQL